MVPITVLLLVMPLIPIPMVNCLPGLREPFDVVKTASDDMDIAYLFEHESGSPALYTGGTTFNQTYEVNMSLLVYCIGRSIDR